MSIKLASARVASVPWWRRLLAFLRVPRIDKRRSHITALLLTLCEREGLPPREPCCPWCGAEVATCDQIEQHPPCRGASRPTPTSMPRPSETRRG